jgi:hypothetical protein
MILDETRERIAEMVALIFLLKPDYSDVIKAQVRRGMTYEKWLEDFKAAGLYDLLQQKGIFVRARARGENGDEILQLFWEETRRFAVMDGTERKA